MLHLHPQTVPPSLYFLPRSCPIPVDLWDAHLWLSPLNLPNLAPHIGMIWHPLLPGIRTQSGDVNHICLWSSPAFDCGPLCGPRDSGFSNIWYLELSDGEKVGEDV